MQVCLSVSHAKIRVVVLPYLCFEDSLDRPDEWSPSEAPIDPQRERRTIPSYTPQVNEKGVANSVSFV